MSDRKTQKTNKSVDDFLKTIDQEWKVSDSKTLISIFSRLTDSEPILWGTSIIGFGESSYSTADGKTHDWMLTGFSPRKQNFALYILPYDDPTGEKEAQKYLDKLGKFKRGKSCLYFNKLDDINLKVLEDLILFTLER